MGLPIIGDIIGLVKGVTDKVIVDKNKKQDIMLQLEQLEAEADKRLHEELMGQIEINKVEAANPNVFVSGWRPFIGWTSGAGVAWTFVVSPFVEFGARLFGWAGQMPQLDTGQLMALVLAMLGIGAQRTFEKVKSVPDAKAIKD